MNEKSNGRRSTRVLNARLDNELDVDLIEWLAAQPYGKRSQALRDLMRDGLRTRQLEASLVHMVRQAVTEALAGIQIVGSQQDESTVANDIEQSFGAQLDQLLDGFG